MKTPAGKFALTLFVILLIFIVVIGWGEDKRSCQRQVIPRTQGNTRERVLYDFLITAADARFSSAAFESGNQKLNDLQTANQYISDAKRLRPVSIPNCNSFIPSDN